MMSRLILRLIDMDLIDGKIVKCIRCLPRKAFIQRQQELKELHYRKIVEPTFIMAEKYFQQWVAQGIIKPADISLTMRAVSGMVLGLIMEHIMGDNILEEQWNKLPDLLTILIMDGLGVKNHDEETH